MRENNQQLSNGSNKINSQKEYKASYYNHFIKYDDKYYFGFNLLYRSIIKIPNEAFQKIDNFSSLSPTAISMDLSSLPSQWLEVLKKTQFIINTDFDELNFIKFRYYRSLYSNDSLTLVILPTLWCNFDCPYCFEYKKPVFMNRKVEDALIKWIENNYRHKRRIHIGWFGGEPLLAKDIIFHLTERIKKFCRDIGATYSSNLVTNGFYLDKDFQSKIPSLGIKNIQITLDGYEEEHNKLRKQRNGKGSFDQIFENILSFCNGVKDCKLTLRINCSDINYESIPKLLESFPHNVKSSINLYFKWIWANEASGYQEFALNQRGTEPYKGLSQLYKESIRLGYKAHNPNNNNRIGYCEVDYLDNYYIDPEGRMYFCAHSDSIGSVLEETNFISPDTIGKYFSWYSVNPFEDNKCVICKLLPICKGGCRNSRFKGSRGCIAELKSLDAFVKNILDERNIQIVHA
jgi:uncharacterized protein